MGRSHSEVRRSSRRKDDIVCMNEPEPELCIIEIIDPNHRLIDPTFVHRGNMCLPRFATKW